MNLVFYISVSQSAAIEICFYGFAKLSISVSSSPIKRHSPLLQSLVFLSPTAFARQRFTPKLSDKSRFVCIQTAEMLFPQDGREQRRNQVFYCIKNNGVMTYDKLCAEPICFVNDLVCYVKSNKHTAYRFVFTAYKQTAVVKIHSGINGCKFLKNSSISFIVVIRASPLAFCDFSVTGIALCLFFKFCYLLFCKKPVCGFYGWLQLCTIQLGLRVFAFLPL